MVRPSTSVEFFVDDAFEQHRAEAYVNTGKLVQVSDATTDDGLIRTVVNQWTTRLDFTGWMADPVVVAYQAARRTYNASHGIVKTDEFEFVASEGDLPPSV